MIDERIQQEQHKLSYYSFGLSIILFILSFFVSILTQNLFYTQLSIIISFMVVSTYYSIFAIKRGLIIKRKNSNLKHFYIFILSGMFWIIISFLSKEINNMKELLIQLLFFSLFYTVIFLSIRSQLLNTFMQTVRSGSLINAVSLASKPTGIPLMLSVLSNWLAVFLIKS